mgnify:FL=1
MTELIKVKTLLKHPQHIHSIDKPRHQGNSGSIWSIIWNGEVVKTNPIGCTPDALSLWAAAHLDKKRIDRSTAMRFGLTFYALCYGCWDVLPDVIFKLNTLVLDDRVKGVLKGTVTTLQKRVMRLAPPDS